jgi:phosphoribosylglycinamide formyltransferase-1
VTRQRAAVLASGGGSNLQALLDYLASLGERRALDVVLVASDRAEAGALDRARRAGIPVEGIRSPGMPQAPELMQLLDAYDVAVVVLAGYLRLVPPDVTGRFTARILNVHPGPLPGFGGAGMYGRRVHRAVLDAGVPFTGPTVHLVDAVYDHGPPLAHWPVPVLAGDDEHVLAARVLRAEHLLFPRIVQRHASMLADTSVSTATEERAPIVFAAFDPSLDDGTLAVRLDAAMAAAASR